jgi:hypothetical protein
MMPRQRRLRPEVPMPMPIVAGLIVGLFLTDSPASKTCSLLTDA